jgi:hypothetical protein
MRRRLRLVCRGAITRWIEDLLAAALTCREKRTTPVESERWVVITDALLSGYGRIIFPPRQPQSWQGLGKRFKLPHTKKCVSACRAGIPVCVLFSFLLCTPGLAHMERLNTHSHQQSPKAAKALSSLCVSKRISNNRETTALKQTTSFSQEGDTRAPHRHRWDPSH